LSRNSSGVYVAPSSSFNDAVTGTVIDPDAWNTLLTDVESGLNFGTTGATDNRLLRADGTGGLTIQSSAITVDDSGNMSGVGTLAAGVITATLTGCTGLPSILVADTTDSTCFVGLFESATGELAPKTDGALLYNASTGALTATSFVGTFTGNADTVTWANEATDTTCFIGFATAASGSLAPKTNTNMTFNSNTGVVTFASSVLTTTDINGGTIDGTVIGGSSAAAGSFTTVSASSNISISSSDPVISITDTDTTALCRVSGNNATGSLYLFADIGVAVADSGVYFNVDNADRMRVISTDLAPTSNDGLALGTTALGWADLHGATGFTWNIANGNAVVTHSSGIFTVSTGDWRITTAGTNTASAVTVGGTQTLTAKTLTSPIIGTSPTAAGATWTDLGTVTTADINGGTLDGVTIGGASAAAITGTTITVNTSLLPDANDGAVLGATGTRFADLFLADGGVLDFGASGSRATITHTAASDSITIAADPDNATASSQIIFSIDGTNELILDGTSLTPGADGGNSLGTTALGWQNLFANTGFVLNIENGNWVATHTSGILTVGTGDLRVTTAGTNTASAVTVGGTQTLTAKTLTSPTITTSPTAAGATWTDLGTVTTADINGGTVDGAVIGGSSAAAATATSLTATQNFFLTGDISPTALAGDVDNYDPTGNSTAAVIRIDGGAANRNITGVVGGADGKIKVLINIGATNSLILKNDTTSTAGNRFLLGADITLTSGQGATLWYDSTSSRWRCIGVFTASGGGGSQTPWTADVDAAGFWLGFDDATGIEDDSGNEQLVFQKTASAVNYWEVTNSATADPATQVLAAVGSDTNIHANITSKGTGVVQANGIPVADVGLLAPQGRLTLTTAVAVTTTDVSGATSIYYTPFGVGRRVPVYNGTTTYMRDTGGELTLALDSDSGHTGYHQSGKIFDVFYAYVAGTYYFGSGPAWTNDTTRSAAISLSTAGFRTNTASMTLRHGSASGNTVTVPAGQGTWLGSFCATANGQASDTVLKRFLFNAFNAVPRFLKVTEATDNWSYSTAAYQQANAASGNKVEVLCGLDGIMVELEIRSVCQNSTATYLDIYAGVGVDSSTVSSATFRSWTAANNAQIFMVEASYKGYPGVGRHDLRWLEYGNPTGGNTQTWFGHNAGGRLLESGLNGTIEA
jgi:hypothetical protein